MNACVCVVVCVRARVCVYACVYVCAHARTHTHTRVYSISFMVFSLHHPADTLKSYVNLCISSEEIKERSLYGRKQMMRCVQSARCFVESNKHS